MSSCFSRCLRVPIAIRAFYESGLWILQTFLLKHPDFHPGLLAMAGETARAESSAQDLNKRFPLDTQVQSLWLPAIRAQLALDRKKPSDALNELQAAAAPIELAQITFVVNI